MRCQNNSMLKWRHMRSWGTTDFPPGTNSPFSFTSPAESGETHCQPMPMIPKPRRFCTLPHTEHAHVCLQDSRPPSSLGCSRHSFPGRALAAVISTQQRRFMEGKGQNPKARRRTVKFCLRHCTQPPGAAMARAPAAAPPLPAANNSAYVSLQQTGSAKWYEIKASSRFRHQCYSIKNSRSLPGDLGANLAKLPGSMCWGAALDSLTPARFIRPC